MGVERWRRGLEESRALSSYALIIQLHKASDTTVYGFLCNVVKNSQQLICQRKHSFYLLNMKSGKTTTDRWRQKEIKFNVCFIAGNDHIKPQICNQEKKKMYLERKYKELSQMVDDYYYDMDQGFWKFLFSQCYTWKIRRNN